MGGKEIDIGNSIAIDNSEGVYIAGYSMGDLDNITNAGDRDAFLVKYNFCKYFRK